MQATSVWSCAANRGERFVWAPLIFEILVAHRYAVLDALPFANEPRAGDRPIFHALATTGRISAIKVFGNGRESLKRFGLQATVGEFLDAVRETAFEEAPVIGRRLRAEKLAPLLFQVDGSSCFQRSYLGQHCVRHVSPSRSLGRA
jgi:hypothetical protein